MTYPPLPSVDPLRMTVTEVLHDAGQRDVPYLYSEMSMVRKQGKRVDSVPESLYAFLQQKAEPAAIYVIKKDILLCIPTDNDVVKGTRIMDSRFS
jgi:hypothetical protein